MANLTAYDATRDLRLLEDAAIERQTTLAEYDRASAPVESDDENDSDCPIFDLFYDSGGSRSIVKMTNFTPRKFLAIWNAVSGDVMQKWNVGRGRKSQYTGKDALFMLLTVLKHGGSWDSLAQMFKIKGLTFGKIICRFMNIVWEVSYELMVERVGKQWKMAQCFSSNRTCTNFK